MTTTTKPTGHVSGEFKISVGHIERGYGRNQSGTVLAVIDSKKGGVAEYGPFIPDNRSDREQAIAAWTREVEQRFTLTPA